MRTFILCLGVALILPQCALAQVMRGKVTLADGAPPMQRVTIERACQGMAPIQDALTAKKGEYFWRVPDEVSGVSLRRHVRIFAW